MFGVHVSVTKFLGFDPQPGIVEFVLIDVFGSVHTFVDKTPVPMEDWGSRDDLKTYPRPGTIRCQIVDQRVDGSGREVVTISTEKPDYVASTTDETVFEVYANQLTSIEDKN